MLGSIARGGVVAASIGVVLALARSLDLPTALWLAATIALHLALPAVAAFSGRRSDVMTLDIGLAGIGVVYMGVVALVDRPANALALYLGLPLGFAAYSMIAALIYTSCASWRRLLRIRGYRALRAQVRSRARASVAA